MMNNRIIIGGVRKFSVIKCGNPFPPNNNNNNSARRVVTQGLRPSVNVKSNKRQSGFKATQAAIKELMHKVDGNGLQPMPLPNASYA